ncbi:MAG: NADH-quinone oxidoreductase subunit L [Candidatus Omnitrophota bacterium]|nr:NADH-quinone oxidoreductase subunit L [Candidatus Omnitrophota bacterium]
MVTDSAYLIPLFPLLAFVINIFFGKKVGKRSAGISIAASAVSFAISLPLVMKVASTGAVYQNAFDWLALDGYTVRMGYLLDPLSATILFMVTLVGTLIQIYSMGYMHDDPRFSRFFAYVSLFMFAMLTLVISNNYMLFFMSWEIMGLCSYLLIGFWFEKNSAANASKKAFLTTRVGDIGLFLGILTLFVAIGTLNFDGLGDAVKSQAQNALLPWAMVLIFCGAIGKSGQFPLHVWLPDAMEGPTPVSALIHAATMVAAGVYLVARSFPLLEACPQAMTVVATVGTITAFMAAFIALTATDIKKVLAYSTVSQLGYMVTALGLGGLAAGTFHLTTHAFFKALLFMGAGSVIHGTGTQDIRELGGLFGKMKSTAWTFLIASLAIAGVPPLSGFWSKDEILLTAYRSESSLIYWILILTSFMTAFYMFRLVFLTFFGKPRNPKIHAHESPLSMTLPLWVLAVGAIVMGLPGSPFMHHWYQNFIHGFHHQGHHEVNIGVMISSVIVGLGGISLAFILYILKPLLAETLTKVFRPLHTASLNKLWFDEFYVACLIRPFHWLGRIMFGFDQKVVDGAVNGTGRGTMFTSVIHDLFDKYVVDGLVNFTGYFTQFWSAVIRRIQTGFVQNYMLIMFVSVLIFMYLELR